MTFDVYWGGNRGVRTKVQLATHEWLPYVIKAMIYRYHSFKMFMMLFFWLKVRYNDAFQLFFVYRPAFNPHSIMRNYCGIKCVKSTINTSTQVESQHINTGQESTGRHKSRVNSLTRVEGQHINTSREATHRHKSRFDISTQVECQHNDTSQVSTHQHKSRVNISCPQHNCKEKLLPASQSWRKRHYG